MLVFTLVVAISVVTTGLMVAIIEVRDPGADTTQLVDSLNSVISGILGALLGLLLGKSSSTPSD